MNSPGTAHALTRENLAAALPPSLQQDPSAVALAETLADQLARRPAEIDRLRLYPEIGRLDEDILDTLAYDFKIDWWDGDYSLAEKRRTMQGNWKVHKLLGTRAAVETGLRAIYPKAWAEPWFDYEEGQGTPYHFRVHIDMSGELYTEGKPERVMERLQYYQSLRDHLDEIRYTMEGEPAVLAIGTGLGSDATIGIPEGRDEFHFSSEVRAGAAAGGADTLLSLPEDTAAPSQVSILRTGGSFVMIAPPILPQG